MADKEIADLPDADLPLVGTERVHIIQSGNSRGASIADFLGTGLSELEATVSMIALQVADNSNVALFLGSSGNRVADSFGALTYVDVAGATNLDTYAPGVLKPTEVPGTPTVMNTNNGSVTASFGNFTYVSRSGTIPNSTTVTHLGIYSLTAKTFKAKILLENSSSSYDVVVDQSCVHAGGGWQDFTLTAPLAVPATGTDVAPNFYPA
jgi:hypothetical protein